MLELKNCFLKNTSHDELKNLSFAVRQGESVALTSSNGAQAATVLQAILGFVPVQSGYITIEGEAMTSASAHFFRGLTAYVPVRFAQFEGTVEDFLAEHRTACAVNAKDYRQRQATLWAQEGLSADLGQTPFAQVGAFERQLILLLTALTAPKPLTLIEDLRCGDSAEHCAQLLRLMTNIAKAGSAVLVTTADTQLAQGCMRQIVLN